MRTETPGGWRRCFWLPKTITDFLNKAEYVSEMSSYDRDMLTGIPSHVVKKVEEAGSGLEKGVRRAVRASD